MAFLDLRYYSNALGKQHAAWALVPEGLEPPYHVLFLLHGLSDDHTIWLRRTSLERYIEGLPLVVVMPDGGRGFYADAKEGYAFGTAIGKELPDLVKKLFPVREDGWAIQGLSMGGYGAFRLALNFPETFVSAVSHSGAMTYGHDAPDAGRGDAWSKEAERILGKDPVGGPDDLFALAQKVTGPKLRLDCGTADFLIENNRNFRKHLESVGRAHEYDEHPGEHNWAYWDAHVMSGIEFHRKNLKF
ncbi:esterase family protein [bacterium]|nr:MAG: esterase family protein [bacterium]